jgi:hypothetical protein
VTRGVVLVVVAALGLLGACGDDDDAESASLMTQAGGVGASDHAADVAAQSELRNGLTAAKTIAIEAAGRFLDSDGNPLDAEDLAAVESSARFDSVVVGEDGADIVLVKVSQSGTAFCIAATAGGAVTYGSVEDPSNVDSIADCVDGSWCWRSASVTPHLTSRFPAPAAATTRCRRTADIRWCSSSIPGTTPRCARRS